MIQATPHNGNPVIYIDAEEGDVVEDMMMRLGYGIDEYNLAAVESFRIRCYVGLTNKIGIAHHD